MTDTIRIGTRGSRLALWQARWVQQQINLRHPELAVDLAVIKTQGDKILDVPLSQVGGKGLFVKEIEEALLDRRIDLAVHSMKDMPALLPPGLRIGAVPQRENPCDALIAKHAAGLEQLTQGSRIGTSSLRRSAQLLHRRPDLKIVPLRGNLETRLNKLATTELDAVVLAWAGLKRLGLSSQVTTTLDPEVVLPAVGQGALCIEAREADHRMAVLLTELDHAPSHTAVTAERAFLKHLEGDCQVPIAAYARIADSRLTLTGLVAQVDGRRVIKDSRSGDIAAARDLGRELAKALLKQGARSLLERLASDVR